MGFQNSAAHPPLQHPGLQDSLGPACIYLVEIGMLLKCKVSLTHLHVVPTVAVA